MKQTPTLVTAGKTRRARTLRLWSLVATLLLLLLTGTGLAQSCTLPPTNIIAWWPGDGHTYDVIGNPFAVLQNGAGYAPGMVGQAFNFEGSTEKVRVLESTSTDLSRLPSWTIEAWVKPVSFANATYPTIYSEGNRIVSLGLNNGTGKLESWVNNDGTRRLISTNALQLTNWNHVALVYDGTRRFLYLNGSLTGSTNTPAITDDGSGAAIGHVTQNDANSPFAGAIDEVSLYNRALTAADILTIATNTAGKCFTNAPLPAFALQPQSQTAYLGETLTLTGIAMGTPRPEYQWQFDGAPLSGETNYTLTISNINFNHDGNYTLVAYNAAGSTSSPVARVSVPFCTSITNLIGWWPADGSGLDAVNRHDGAMWGNTTFGPGVAGSAFNFNGTNAYVAVPDAPELSPHVGTNGEMTVEVWIKLDQLPQPDTVTGQNQRTVLAKVGPGQWEYGLSVTNTGAGGVPKFFLWNSNGGVCASITGGQILTGQWHHIIATVKKSDAVRLYQDGQLVGSSTNFTGITGNGNSPLYIGRRGDAQFLQGWVDEAALYSRALTSDEVAALYSAAGFGKCSDAPSPAPWFTRQPENQTGYVLLGAGLTSFANGTPRPSYQWQRSNDTAWVAISRQTNGSLVLTNLSEAFEGNYRVVATNPHGSTTSAPVYLKVGLHDILSGGEHFEKGWNGWETDTNLWQIGTQTNQANGVAATGFNGNYPRETSSRLITPVFDLPAITAGETLVLEYWQWFEYWAGLITTFCGADRVVSVDGGLVQIQVFDPTTRQWSGWTNLLAVSGYSPVWSQAQADLAAYAGRRVRIGFHHSDSTEDAESCGGSYHYESTGWFIDDVSISVRSVTPPPPGGVGFENGWAGWSADNGVWEVGVPRSGPTNAHSGRQLVGTVLAGNYPYETESRLLSPIYDLPAITAGETLVLEYWQWFEYWAGLITTFCGADRVVSVDGGLVQIQVFDPTTRQWSGWTNLLAVSGYSPVWSQAQADLAAYAGRRVRIGFHHSDSTEDGDACGGSYHYESTGWFIDDVSISVRSVTPPPPGGVGFENGWAGWSADNGVWEVGVPRSGPTNAHSGRQLVGTVLAGNYPYETESRLLSPIYDLPAITAGETLVLEYWQWFEYWAGLITTFCGGGDRVVSVDGGLVQIQVFNPTTRQWSGWTNLLAVNGYSPVWSQAQADLAAYAGRRVRIGFHHSDSTEDGEPCGGAYHYESTGWFIDDVNISVRSVPPPPPGGVGFENGWTGWSAENGVWEVGIPRSGPTNAHSGRQLVGTVLAGNYPYETESRLLSPIYDLPVITAGETLVLEYWQWFEYWAGLITTFCGADRVVSVDGGLVQIQVFDPTTRQWSGWTNLLAVSGYSPVWSQAQADLAAYAGRRVRIGFHHSDSTEDAEPCGGAYHYESTGWFIDDVNISVRSVPPPPPGGVGFENGWTGWSAENGVWEVGIPRSGPTNAHSGRQLVGTVLAGNYPYETESRLLSPIYDLPVITAGETLVLEYWQWFEYWAGLITTFCGGGDRVVSVDGGLVQIQVFNPTTRQWSGWTNLLAVSGYSPVWSLAQADLAAYAGRRVRIGFHHTDSTEDGDACGGYYHYESTGWFIDDVFVKRGNLAIASIADKTVNELERLTFPVTVIGTDANSCVTCQLIDPPKGATIDPTTCVFSWTPEECQGPATYNIGIYVVDYCNNEANDLGFVKVTVNEMNERPWLMAHTNSVDVLQTNLIPLACWGDADCPRNPLAFSLVFGAPAGASLDTNGVFRWVPTLAQLRTQPYVMQVRLCDNGSPNYCVTNFLSVTVTTNSVLQIQPLSGNDYQVSILKGRTDRSYILQESATPCWCSCATPWHDVMTVSPTTIPFTFMIRSEHPHMFFQLREVPRVP